MTDAYAASWAAINRLVREGYSWSGREANTTFLNLGDGSFADISAHSGLDFAEDGRAFAVADWDADGDLDLWLVNRTAPRLRLMMNTAARDNRYIAFRLTGTTVNRDGIGTRIRLSDGTDVYEKILQAGSGYISQSSKWLHFGVGSSERVDVAVIWPDGTSQDFASVSTEQSYHLVQDGQLVPRPRPRPSLPLATARQVPLAAREQVRIALTAPVPIPAMAITDFKGQNRDLPGRMGRANKPVLINFWASWCMPCLGEMKQWQQARARLGSRLDILAISVDEDEQAAKTYLKRLKPWFPAASATDDWVIAFDLMQRSLTDRRRPMPIPTSFLIDRDGRLACVYKGPVPIATLLRDLDDLAAGSLNTMPFPGKRHGEAPTPPLFTLANSFIEAESFDQARFYLEAVEDIVGPPGRVNNSVRQLAATYKRLGLRFQENGQHERALQTMAKSAAYFSEDAVTFFLRGQMNFKRKAYSEAFGDYRRAVEIDPKNGAAWHALGVLHFMSGRRDQALQAYTRSVEVDPQQVEPWFSLGVFHLTAGDCAKATPSFQKTLELEPNHSKALTGHATCLLQSGQKAEARIALQRALEHDPANARAADMLARLQ